MPEELSAHNEGRRNFIKNAGLTAVAVSALGTNWFFSGKSKEQSIDEYLEYWKQFKFPAIEKFPEYLQTQAKEYGDWIKAVEEQRRMLVDFFKSEFYRRSLKQQLVTSGENGSDGEIDKIVNEIIKVRIKDTNKLKKMPWRYFFSNNQIILNTIEGNDMGQYREKLEGKITSDQILLDTLKQGQMFVGVINNSDGSLNRMIIAETIDLFTAIHELYHSALSADSITKGAYKAILELWSELKLISKEDFPQEKVNLILEKATTDPKTHLMSSGFPSESPEVSDYPFKLVEVPAYLMHIRTIMHTVSQTNPSFIGCPPFNMNKDDFTLDHLEFLLKNKDKMFMPKTIITMNEAGEATNSVEYFPIDYYDVFFTSEERKKAFVKAMNIIL